MHVSCLNNQTVVATCTYLPLRGIHLHEESYGRNSSMDVDDDAYIYYGELYGISVL